MTIENLKNLGLIIFECISGSRAYGLETANSDIDIRGVFILPKSHFYGLEPIDQVSNSTNDIVYYELKKFIFLLTKSNPTALEMLYAPIATISICHPLFDILRKQHFLSKQCKETFGGYAITQIKKARGLNKKILNPMSKTPKNVLDFCFVTSQQGSKPLKKFLEERGIEQEQCGLVNLPNMEDCYGLYVGNYQGIVKSEKANDVALSSVEGGSVAEAVVYFNRSGYSTYCKEYKAYWQWVEQRNDERFKRTAFEGKKYDTKNMMHTFRLLKMCLEIAQENKLNVRRNDREFLLMIKDGKFDYAQLIAKSEALQNQIKVGYQDCILPEKPDVSLLESLLMEIRERYYLEQR